jgi:NADH-quinone oxidoreductase subunit E
VTENTPQELTDTGSDEKDLSEVEAIVRRHGGDKSSLIQVLLEIQRRKRWLSEDDLRTVSESLGVPPAQVYHIATFYKAFSLVPKGEHQIAVCLGTACQVRNAPLLLDRVIEVFKVKPGRTSPDLRFSLDTVNCLGCCALGPVMMMDGEYYSKPSKEDLERLAAGE